MHGFFGELIGTMTLILLGNGVVAGVSLKGSYAENGGWIVITTAWGLAVICAVIVALAVGYWASRAELVRNWGVEKRWQPAMPSAQRAKLYAAWQKAVRRSFDWVDRPA